jgi:hypothetical protein
MDHIQEVLCGDQHQEGNLKLLMEEAELLQHLQGSLGSDGNGWVLLKNSPDI